MSKRKVTQDELDEMMLGHYEWHWQVEGFQRLSLTDCDLRGLDFRGNSLVGCDLSGSDLTGADLSSCDLAGSNLSGCNLSAANLRHTSLSKADLRGATLPAGVPIVPNIDAAILGAINQPGNELDMDDWHGPLWYDNTKRTCSTTHCRAGWAIHLAGPAGYALEDRVGAGVAGALIYAASRPAKAVPDFHCTDKEALEDLKFAAGQTPAGGDQR